jgi:DNA-binding NarL/FixJ family response regulator
MLANRHATHNPVIFGPQRSKVIEWLFMGYSDPEIAERLGISRRTVKAHIAGISSTLGIRHNPLYHHRIRIVYLIHDIRTVFGVRCYSCDGFPTR